MRPPINEVQTASLRDFDGTDSFKVELNGAQSATITNGANYSAAGIQVALQGVSEIQTVALVGYDGTDSYTLEYKGATTVPIVRGQNNTAAGIQNALQGGNEQQQAVLTGFNATAQSFQIEANGNTSALFGLGGLAVSNANVTAQINALLGSTGVTSAGAGNGGFTLTFGGTLAGTDVAAISIVNCTGACVATVRETAKGGGPIAGWPAGGTVAAGSVTDAGYTLTFGGAHQGTDVDPISVTNATGVTGAVIETVKGTQGMLPPGAVATVAGFGAGTFNTTGFQVTFGGTLGLVNVNSLAFVDLTGATGWFGETARGGAIDNQGWQVTSTGNIPPVVETPVEYTIPLPDAVRAHRVRHRRRRRHPHVPVGAERQRCRGRHSARQSEQDERPDLPPVRHRARRERLQPEATQLARGEPRHDRPDSDVPRPGADPDQQHECRHRRLPRPADPAQSAFGGTNVPQPQIDCYSEFLPTASIQARCTSVSPRVTAIRPAAGSRARTPPSRSHPGTGPFLVTSHGAGGTVDGHAPVTVTWDVAGTNLAPIATENVKISLSADGGLTYPHVLAASTPNDGSEVVPVANVATAKARLKVEAVDNVFFDLNDADFAIQGVADVTNDAPPAGAAVQYSDALSPTVTVSATDPDTAGSGLTAVASGLPTGMTLAVGTTSAGATLPGTRTWTVVGTTTAAPGDVSRHGHRDRRREPCLDDDVRDRGHAGGRDAELHRRRARLPGRWRFVGEREPERRRP